MGLASGRMFRHITPLWPGTAQARPSGAGERVYDTAPVGKPPALDR